MDRWQHLSLTLERRYFGTMDNPYSEWVLQLNEGDEVQGLDVILDRYGAQGWELVSVTPTTWGKTDVKTLTVIFKRQAE